MRLQTLVWKELRERPSAMLTSGLAILLGVASLVFIRHVTVHSEREVSRQLSTLGANILILPKDASLQDYYAADQNGRTLPEEHVSEVLLAGLTGVEKLSPKLSVPAKVGDLDVTLTGILPQSEFQTKAAWQTAKAATWAVTCQQQVVKATKKTRCMTRPLRLFCKTAWRRSRWFKGI